ALVQGRSDPGHDPGAPARVPLAVIPAVDGGTGQADPAEGHVVEGEAHMSGGHVPTVTAPTDRAAEAHRPRRTIETAMSDPIRPFRFLAAFQAVVGGPELIATARRAE